MLSPFSRRAQSRRQYFAPVVLALWELPPWQAGRLDRVRTAASMRHAGLPKGARVRSAHYDSYVICTSPRSGSTLLCALLAASGVAGKPESYFHLPSVAEWQADLGLPPSSSEPEEAVLAAVFRAAIARGRAGTALFGLRLQRHSFDYLLQKLGVLHPDRPGDLQRFEAAFGRTLFIHLTREDKLEQTVSLVKAEQSGLWHRAPDGSEIERLSPPRPLRYDRKRIAAQRDALAAMDRAWTDWFASAGIEPLRVTYGALAADPLGTLRVLLSRLGLDPAAARGVKPGVAKLSDRTNRDWVARFRAGQAGD